MRYPLACVLLALVLCFTVLGIPRSYAADGAIADPSEIGVGARPLGMGMAFAAIADDGSAIYMNPAGLGDFKTMKLTSMSGSILQDVGYVVLGASNPFYFGTLGAGYINVGVNGIPVTTLTGGITPEFTGQYTSYNAGLFFLSYGTRLDRFLSFGFAKDVEIGTSAKIFLQGFSGGGPSVEGASGTGFDMDLGAIYKPVGWGSLGVNFINFLPDSIAKFVWPAGGSRPDNIEESIPMVVKLGGALKVMGADSLHPEYPQDLLLDLDLDMNTAARPGVWHLGGEWWPTTVLALRAGIDQKPAANATGIGVDNNLTFGIGIKYAGYTFDYAYHQYGEFTENTTHYFSIGYVGEDRLEKKKTKIAEAVNGSATSEPVITPVFKPKPVLKTFSDVPQGYWAKDAIEYLATIGILGGYPDGTFKPETPLTRAELSAILVRARGIAPAAVSDKPYPDLAVDNWAAGYVKDASDMKLVSGYPDGSFMPGKSLSRAEGVVIVSRFAELATPKSVTADPFPDVSTKHWAAFEIKSALDAGLLDYLNGGKFEPARELTRAEVAEILSKTPWGKDQIKKLLSGA